MQEGIVSVDLNSESPSSCSRIGDLIANYIEDKGAVFIKKRNTEESKGGVDLNWIAGSFG
jgi:hypothetical protein|nr:hypothetical protein [uncultured bacterium]